MNTLRYSPPPVVHAIFIYLILFPVFLFLAALIWSQTVSGVLYSSADGVGIFDFISPFVHPYEMADAYYVPAWRVYLLWYFMLASTVLLPAFIVGALWFIWRKEYEYDT